MEDGTAHQDCLRVAVPPVSGVGSSDYRHRLLLRRCGACSVAGDGLHGQRCIYNSSLPRQHRAAAARHHPRALHTLSHTLPIATVSSSYRWTVPLFHSSALHRSLSLAPLMETMDGLSGTVQQLIRYIHHSASQHCTCSSSTPGRFSNWLPVCSRQHGLSARPSQLHPADAAALPCVLTPSFALLATGITASLASPPQRRSAARHRHAIPRPHVSCFCGLPETQPTRSTDHDHDAGGLYPSEYCTSW